VTTELEALVARELDAAVPGGAHRVADYLRARFGTALRAVLMYGSNLRRGEDGEGVLDLYAFVSSYADAYPGRSALAAINRLLPPNVFYVELPGERGSVRCKYAVLALDDLPRLTSEQVREPYFWARFAQPCALVWAADAASRAIVTGALTGAIATFVRFAVPFAAARFDAAQLWTKAWQASYGAELRPERADSAQALWSSNAARFEQVTSLAVRSLPWEVTIDGNEYVVDMPLADRRRALRVWRIQRLAAKLRFLLRMLRNGLIFDGGVDYVLWKIQRHSGVAVDANWRERRCPWLALGVEAWRLYRAGAFR
jgi:hypothetical protein